MDTAATPQDHGTSLGWFAGAGPRAMEEQRRLRAAGARLVGWDDPAYPASLRGIADPPLVLAMRGALVAAEPMVAIVGTRRASEYGRRMAADLARGLAVEGVAVVSGFAAGIDAAAHAGALAAGGRTIAVLATGIDVISPACHAELARGIARRGALVTELRCGTPALPFRFHRRNWVLSGLALAVVVVEAPEGSGALITARSALAQGRTLCAVPGPVGRAHEGCHRLIREGARLVTRARDILDTLDRTPARPAVPTRTAREPDLTALERQLFGALGADAQHIDAVVRRAEVAPDAALETLLALELRGLVEQCSGTRFRRLDTVVS